MRHLPRVTRALPIAMPHWSGGENSSSPVGIRTITVSTAALWQDSGSNDTGAHLHSCVTDDIWTVITHYRWLFTVKHYSFRCIVISQFSYVDNSRHFNLTDFPQVLIYYTGKLWWRAIPKFCVFSIAILLKSSISDAREIYMFYSKLTAVPRKRNRHALAKRTAVEFSPRPLWDIWATRITTGCSFLPWSSKIRAHKRL